ncbi:MAG: M48 family metallopeptidase, partial [Thiolinea sp.]
MTAEKIRCDKDVLLANSLLEAPEVKRVNRWIEEHESDKPNSIRRHLLSTSVRLSPQISPRLHKMAKHCGDALGLELPLELYAFSSPQYNAACFKPEDGRLYIMFSSAILEAFDEKELLYVMGHEIGHHIYHHHDIPIGYILRGKARPPADLALKLFAWSRYAEFSADRAGAYCTNDLDSVARALFKLASGVSRFAAPDVESLIEFDLEEFISQVDDMVDEDANPGQGAPTQDWFSTHPFSPLRVKALAHFHESVLMTPDGYDKDALEVHVNGLMKLMEPGYLEAKSRDARAMRNLFIAAAINLAELGGGISDEEREVLQQFL